MIRMTRLTDYGILLLTHFARGGDELRSARDLARAARLPQPTVSKLLKTLAHRNLLETHRGVKGGFRLIRRPEEMTVLEIIHALEGPVALTECNDHDTGECGIEKLCPMRSNWRKINDAVLRALAGITLADLTQPLKSAGSPVLPGRGLALRMHRKAEGA